MKDNKYIISIVRIFWIFIIGSVIGYIVEMIVGFVQNHGQFVSRQGLLFGPFIPVYGVGLSIYYIIIPRIKTLDNPKIFIYSMILGGITEYLFSYFQEKLFGSISWDYSNLLFNFNGRTSLLHCVYWGIGGVLFMDWVYPLINNFFKYFEKTKYLTALLVVFMLFNISISCLAANRQEERLKFIEADNEIDLFLDRFFPNDTMDKIYSNKKIVLSIENCKR